MPVLASANVLRLPSQQSVRLDDGPAAIALCQRVIRQSHWNYGKIADRSGVCALTVSRLAYGDTKRPQMATVVRILTALGWQVWADHHG